jgi:hypothetical protein
MMEPSLTELRLRNTEAKLARLIEAGVKAEDESPGGRWAQKLRRLTERCEKARDLYKKGWDAEAHAELCRAIEQAKKP